MVSEPITQMMIVAKRIYRNRNAAFTLDRWITAVIIAKMKMLITASALMALLCGCVPKYRNAPWADCVYGSGKAYVMHGTETLKTATLLTADGTFKEFTFPVERRFDVFESGEPQRNVGHFVHKARDCYHSYYRFFPSQNTLISIEGWDFKIQNLTLRKSFRVKGTIIDHSDSRFCLAQAYNNTNHLWEVDKINGHSIQMTKATVDFVGDTWHVHLFVSEDGHRITRTETDYAKKTVTISAWDIQREFLLFKPHTVSYTNEFDEPTVRLCQAEDDVILLVVSDGNEFTRKARKMLIRTFTPDSFAVRQNIRVEFNGHSPQAIKEGPNTVAVLWTYREKESQPSYRWGLKRYDLTTGQCIHTETIESPGF